MRPTDVDRVAALEEEVFTTPWKPGTFRAMLDRPDVELWVADGADAGVVGYAVLWWVKDEGELANIAIAPGQRGRGSGSRLLDRMLERARAHDLARVFLEVRESNDRALGMYGRRGFEPVGRRERYYSRPAEDALVLVKRLKP